MDTNTDNRSVDNPTDNEIALVQSKAVENVQQRKLSKKEWREEKEKQKEECLKNNASVQGGVKDKSKYNRISEGVLAYQLKTAN